MALLLVALGGASCGTTPADKLEVGSCFVMPDDGLFTSVENQPCDEPHEAQVFAKVAPLALAQENLAPDCGSDFAARLDEFRGSVDESTLSRLDLPDCVAPGERAPQKSLDDECLERLLVLVEGRSLPEDVVLSVIIDEEVSPTAASYGDCVIESPSGQLIGSLVGQ